MVIYAKIRRMFYREHLTISDRMITLFKRMDAETPPRAWGRLSQRVTDARAMGNTPTGVGKTQVRINHTGVTVKHPHGRGEDLPDRRILSSIAETPPRAWGRQLTISTKLVEVGNTPTGVGKTRQTALRSLWPWKHPHGRGEDF